MVYILILYAAQCLEEKWADAPVITPRNSVRVAVNERQLLRRAAQLGVRAIKWQAVDTYKKGLLVTTNPGL